MTGTASREAEVAAAKTINTLLHLPAQMELSQIELIYRAEGNANLVLALPQFKKVLRLPKMISSRQALQQQRSIRPQAQPEAKQQQQERSPPHVSMKTKTSREKAGDLTMPDFMAYIEIMRRLLGNEFVCEADIVAIPKESDRFWINDHIRNARPIARLDKEFVGPFGLLMPDVTQLPPMFDTLLANLQAKGTSTDTDTSVDTGTTTTTILGDTYAIEIKPKQGWMLLPSDVSDLFDLTPAGATAATVMPTPAVGRQQATGSTATTTVISTSNVAATEQSLPIATAAKLTKPDCMCRFCSMQLLKLKNGKIKRLSAYCPMELFSGAPGRMLDALSALFACPQNNLRVFRNGNLIYGDHENSISCEELHSRVFQGEIMVLIKHLLVACLLREYSQDGHVAAELYVDPKAAQSTEVEAESAADEKTKAEAEAETETEAQAVEIGAPNVKATVDASAGAVDDIVKAAAGQPQRLNAAVVAAVAAATTTTATRAAAAKETQIYTKRGKVTKTTTATRTARQTTTESVEATMATATSTWESTTIEPSTCAKSTRTTTTTTANVAMATETNAETKTETEPLATQAQINTTEISCLPKNCVLQKIVHLQFLVKRHFRYMAETGYATQVTTTYNALRTLLAREKEQTQVQGIGYIDGLEAEQAYMLGATALDCSIMLTFREIQCQNVSAMELERLEPWHVHLANFQRHFIAKVSVLDLDPKPDSHFHKFIQQTREIEKCGQALN